MIVADIAMPLMNGLDACEQIKKQVESHEYHLLRLWNEDKDLAGEVSSPGSVGISSEGFCLGELTQAVHAVIKNKSYVSPFGSWRNLVSLLILADR